MYGPRPLIAYIQFTHEIKRFNEKMRRLANPNNDDDDDDDYNSTKQSGTEKKLIKREEKKKKQSTNQIQKDRDYFQFTIDRFSVAIHLNDRRIKKKQPNERSDTLTRKKENHTQQHNETNLSPANSTQNLYIYI